MQNLVIASQAYFTLTRVNFDFYTTKCEHQIPGSHTYGSTVSMLEMGNSTESSDTHRHSPTYYFNSHFPGKPWLSSCTSLTIYS